MMILLYITGKTELAKALAEYLFQDASSMVTIDSKLFYFYLNDPSHFLRFRLLMCVCVCWISFQRIILFVIHVMLRSCSSILLCYAMLCYAMLCYAMLCYAMLCYAMLCYAMLCHAMLCYAMPCHAMPCHAMLCYALLWFVLPWPALLFSALLSSLLTNLIIVAYSVRSFN